MLHHVPPVHIGLQCANDHHTKINKGKACRRAF